MLKSADETLVEFRRVAMDAVLRVQKQREYAKGPGFESMMRFQIGLDDFPSGSNTPDPDVKDDSCDLVIGEPGSNISFESLESALKTMQDE